jgi:hypothetical protein
MTHMMANRQCDIGHMCSCSSFIGRSLLQSFGSAAAGTRLRLLLVGRDVPPMDSGCLKISRKETPAEAALFPTDYANTLEIKLYSSIIGDVSCCGLLRNVRPQSEHESRITIHLSLHWQRVVARQSFRFIHAVAVVAVVVVLLRLVLLGSLEHRNSPIGHITCSLGPCITDATRNNG